MEIKNTYEVLFALSVKNGEETAQATAEKIKDLIAENSEIVAEDVWGKRRLAYPINYETEGYYVLIYFRSLPAFVTELTRVLGITEDALRYMILSVDEKKQPINVSHKPAPAIEAVSDDEDVKYEKVEAAAETVSAEPIEITETIETAEASEPEAETEPEAAK